MPNASSFILAAAEETLVSGDTTVGALVMIDSIVVMLIKTMGALFMAPSSAFSRYRVSVCVMSVAAAVRGFCVKSLEIVVFLGLTVTCWLASGTDSDHRSSGRLRTEEYITQLMYAGAGEALFTSIAFNYTPPEDVLYRRWTGGLGGG